VRFTITIVNWVAKSWGLQ